MVEKGRIISEGVNFVKFILTGYQPPLTEEKLQRALKVGPHLALVELLHSGQYDLDSLASRIGTSPRAVNYFIDALKAERVNIVSDQEGKLTIPPLFPPRKFIS